MSGVYLATMMVLTTTATVLAVLVLRVHHQVHRGDDAVSDDGNGDNDIDSVEDGRHIYQQKCELNDNTVITNHHLKVSKITTRGEEVCLSLLLCEQSPGEREIF